ncbi:hypothetical protein [Nannocystis punicea]|uniref:Uncharacterized protein n=1 Tax=Nannocystis punicea TaxID=2995304 RepID=A0ABY7HBJ8_9BACT|nr:hypothetical protein [Nannocystis poenicansa]WAS96482.1 hypothetical protein O0S08_10010 [Nannocystis poenicansa]
MRPWLAPTLALTLAPLAGCNEVDALYAAGKAVPPGEPTATTGTTGTGGPGEQTSDTTGASSGEGTGGATSEGPDATSFGPTSIGTDSMGDAPVEPPSIEVLIVPFKVTTAGPMPVSVYAKHALTAKVVLDDKETFYLENEGDADLDGVDLFSGAIPIYGSPDNGLHSLVATVQRGELTDELGRKFEVSTPPAGALAWEKFGGAGTKDSRLAVTSDGSVVEGGALTINGVAHPAIRLRDPITGNDLWPEGTRVLDAREGSIADIALTQNGDVWVAMNVKDGNVWTARLALFTPDMAPTGAQLEKPGATIQAIDTTDAGGCFGAGFFTTLYGDTDMLVWHVAADGTPILSGLPWDYTPDEKPHQFTDLAFDVVVSKLTDEAWIVGGARGKHNLNEPASETRAVIVHVDIDTFEHLSPVFIRPPKGNIQQSLFLGAWIETEGLLVTGYQCDMMCLGQSVIAERYSLAGVPQWGFETPPNGASAGNAIASTTHGTIVIAAMMKEGDTTHGFLLGRAGAEQAFAPVAFPGSGTSSATSFVVGPYDWLFGGGNVTMGGVPQGYVLRLHP